jgi:hypothetical protein
VIDQSLGLGQVTKPQAMLALAKIYQFTGGNPGHDQQVLPPVKNPTLTRSTAGDFLNNFEKSLNKPNLTVIIRLKS